MNRLVVSDLHLGKKFDQKKFNYLKDLFSKYSEIIINGDFWDYYSVTFDDFINGKWKNLFPHLQNKAIYIYGNHDKKKWTDGRANLFSKTQAEEFVLDIKNKQFVFSHGHLIDNFRQIEQRYFVKLTRLLRVMDFGLFFDVRIKRSKAEFNDFNKKVKAFAEKLPYNTVLITGHSHKPIVEIPNKYSVGGSIMHGQSKYLEIDENGKVNLIQEKY